MKKTTILSMSVVLILVLALALSGCGAALKEAAKLNEYEVGDDNIPSITSVVGEREVTGIESSVDNGISSKKYTYKSTTVYDDLLSYVTALMDQGWRVTKDIDLKIVPGSGELGKKSADDGEILLVSFSYEESEYVIKIIKAKGTLE